MVEILPANSSINDIFAGLQTSVNQGFDVLVQSTSQALQQGVSNTVNATKETINNAVNPAKVTNQDQPTSANQALLSTAQTFVKNNILLVYAGIGLIALGTIVYIVKKR